MVLNAKSKFPIFQPFPFTSFEKKFCRILMPLFKKIVLNINIQNYKRKIAKFLHFLIKTALCIYFSRSLTQKNEKFYT